MIRIILIEDHILVRQSMHRLLQETKNIQIVGEAGSGNEGIQLVRSLQPDVAILDLKLPDISGLEVISRLQHLNAPSHILVVTAVDHLEFILRAFDAGALGYLNKTVSKEEWITAIKTVSRGQPYLSADIASRLALVKIDPNLKGVFNALNSKEMEMLLFTARGLSVDEIGNRLFLSPKTVRSYRSHLFEKLNINNDVALTLLCIREGLISIDELGN